MLLKQIMLLGHLMEFFVLFVLFWGVLFGTALSLVTREDGKEIPVNQPFEKLEENESKEELKKWESVTHLFRTLSIDFVLVKSIDSLIHETSFVSKVVTLSPDSSRAPPASLC
ncbi:hypothetical protein Enr17x_39420 [Gimesia fumaroli]|uniref:Uncharacterized protein n=2 Tax=Gimesia fumaroli TaxID=2527976 RepID=A0A518IFK8_9PLAN|nr:hypothetical protein Enr17x_39420 [Gimesia fumaroli]